MVNGSHSKLIHPASSLVLETSLANVNTIACLNRIKNSEQCWENYWLLICSSSIAILTELIIKPTVQTIITTYGLVNGLTSFTTKYVIYSIKMFVLQSHGDLARVSPKQPSSTAVLVKWNLSWAPNPKISIILPNNSHQLYKLGKVI